MNVLVKPNVTKPWSKEMYDYNDEVADIMKNNIIKSIVKYQNDFDKLNELMELCGGIKYGCLLYTSPSPRDGLLSRMPSSA